MKRVVLFSWVVLCLCGLGSILAAEKDKPEVIVGVSLTASNKPPGKEHLDFHHTARQHPDVESSDAASPSLSSGWNEPLFRRPWNEDSSISSRNDEYQNYQGPSDPSDSSEYWQENNAISSANQDVDVHSIEQLNWRDSQLARLHGLGPAEIAALSSWQNRLRMNSLPKRITERLSKEQVKSTSRSLPWISTDSALFPQVLTTEIQADHNNLASKDLTDETRQTNQTQDDEDILPMWPKRSSNANKIDKENSNKVRNSSNRKEKSESSGGNKGGKGKGTNRKQQQIKQETSRRHISEEAVGIDISGTDGAHENSKSSSGSSGQAADVSRLNRNLATQFLLRSPRENRQYDVPIIGEKKKNFV